MTTAVELTVKKTRKKTPETGVVDFQAMVEETRAKMQTPTKTSKLKKAKAALTPAPALEPAPDLLAPFRADLGDLVPTLEPRQSVAMMLDGRLMYGAVLTVSDGVATVLRISSGQFKVPLADCAPAALVPGTGLAEGDLVTLTMRPGLWRVTRLDGQAQVYACEQVDAPDETTFTPLSGVRVVRRVSLAHTCADLGQPPAVAEQLAPSTPAVDEDLPFPVTVEQLDAATVPAPQPAPTSAAPEPEPAPLPVLPGTPVLISPADLAPGTLGLHAVPLHQTTRSGCNVRHHYDPTAIEELAASLRAEGQIENATGRWSADGQVEIVAGESRRRAQVLRAEQGDQDVTLLVNIRQLTDAEALSISATENMRRRSMTALEECEAMQRLNDAGRSVEDLQIMFGYKSAQPVADRILVGRALHTTPRELLDRGELSLAQAVIIARAPGQDLQLSMTTAATRDYNPASATDLSKQLTKGQFLVKTAKFNADKSGLDVVNDLFGAFEPYFKDKGQALNAQMEWANARAEKARAKGKHPFVAVESGSGTAYGVLDGSRKYEYSYSSPVNATGLIYYINTDDGSVSEETSYRLKASAKQEAVKAGEAKADAPTRPISDAAYQEAHERRALALRESVVGNTHMTLALTVWGLLVSDSVGMVKHGEVHGLPRELAGMPELAAAVERLRDRIRPGTHAKGTAYNQHPLLNGNSVADRQPMLALLLSFTDQELLECLNTLTALSAYDWPQYSNQSKVRAEYSYLASLTDAPQRLAANFKLTDEWLKRYPREALLDLAREAGLELAPLEACKTQKEMRALIVEQAERLHRDGYVPSLLRFPAPTEG